MWTEWNNTITNNDLGARFSPIMIMGSNGDTFSGTLKNKLYSSVAFVAFSTGVSDNPFSFEEGYAIVFHSGLVAHENIFTLMGFNKNGSGGIELRVLNFR